MLLHKVIVPIGGMNVQSGIDNNPESAWLTDWVGVLVFKHPMFSKHRMFSGMIRLAAHQDAQHLQ